MAYTRPLLFFRNVLLLMLLCALASCGFQWRGSAPQSLGFRTLYLSSSAPYGHFNRALKQALLATGADVRTSPPASVTLQIYSQDFARIPTSLGHAGQTTTYLLSYTVVFRLLDRTNRVLLPTQQVRATRNFSISSNQLSGDLNTQNSFEADLQRDVIEQMITRLATSMRHLQACPTDSTYG